MILMFLIHHQISVTLVINNKPASVIKCANSPSCVKRSYLTQRLIFGVVRC